MEEIGQTCRSMYLFHQPAPTSPLWAALQCLIEEQASRNVVVQEAKWITWLQCGLVIR
jgi:hypothetical protein